MSHYQCQRCFFITKQKTGMIRHLDRKNKCIKNRDNKLELIKNKENKL